jgi:hypothetical protein
MDDIPPPRHFRGRGSHGPSVPLIPVLLGVIVLGLAFGAGLSVLLQRNTKSPVAIVTAAPAPTSTPTASATGPGLTLNVPKSPPTPGAMPTSRRVAIAASPLVVAPVPAAVVTAVRITPKPAATLPPYAVREAPRPVTAAPLPVPTAAPTTDEADSEFARLSAGVVRSYLGALARGDDASARTVLDGPRGSPAVRLSEREFADPSLRIVKLDAHGISDSATVNVDLSTSKGAYFEQFSLRRSPTGAALIIEHTFIRP